MEVHHFAKRVNYAADGCSQRVFESGHKQEDQEAGVTFQGVLVASLNAVEGEAGLAAAFSIQSRVGDVVLLPVMRKICSSKTSNVGAFGASIGAETSQPPLSEPAKKNRTEEG